MKKIILGMLILVSSSVYAFKYTPNEQINESMWVDGKYITRHTTVDSTGNSATTSGWVNGKYETEHTQINQSGKSATVSGWKDGKYITKHYTFD